MNVGDKILVVAKGPHGCGLVEATVCFVYSRSDIFSIGSGYAPEVNGTGMRDDQEGIVWTRGHDPTTPEACALLTAAALSR